MVWSNNERHWKPVPVSTSSTMKAARQAAREVDTLLSLPKSGCRTRTAIGSQAMLPGEAEHAYQPGPEAVDKAIAAAARPHGVDRNLVRAVIKVESNFNPHAVSPKGAMGLIELMPYTAKSLNVGNAFENVDAGVRHLKTLLENYNGNVELSLAAHNTGSGAVNPSCGMPPRETRDYMKRIIDLYRGDAFRPRVEETRDAEGHRYFSNNE
jgi:soluble lytic murein transglycosylase-like protein